MKLSVAVLSFLEHTTWVMLKPLIFSSPKTHNKKMWGSLQHEGERLMNNVKMTVVEILIYFHKGHDNGDV